MGTLSIWSFLLLQLPCYYTILIPFPPLWFFLLCLPQWFSPLYPWWRSQTLEPPCPIRIPAVPLTRCVTLGKILNLSLPRFPYRWKEDNKNTYLKGLLWGLDRLIDVQHVEESPAPGKSYGSFYSCCCWHSHLSTQVPVSEQTMASPDITSASQSLHSALVARNVIRFLCLPGLLIPPCSGVWQLQNSFILLCVSDIGTPISTPDPSREPQHCLLNNPWLWGLKRVLHSPDKAWLASAWLVGSRALSCGADPLWSFPHTTEHCYCQVSLSFSCSIMVSGLCGLVGRPNSKIRRMLI